MARTAAPLREGEWVYYTAPGRTIRERVVIARIYQTRTGRRVRVMTKDGTELSVRPSQLTRR